MSYNNCVAFDFDSGESITLATVTQGSTSGGAASATRLPLGDIADNSIEGRQVGEQDLGEMIRHGMCMSRSAAECPESCSNQVGYH